MSRQPDKHKTHLNWNGQTTEVRAWKMTPAASSVTANVTSWLVEGPFHPAWSQWMITAIHLRDVEGVPAPDMPDDKPEATHQIHIIALNPDHPIDPAVAIGPEQTLYHLDPPDLVVYLERVSDDDVAAIVEEMVDLIVDAVMSPDSDYRRHWVEWLLRKEAEHV